MSTETPYLVDKPVGSTPLEALGLLRRQLKLADDFKLSYAGRLDPMASGLLVVLHGDLLKQQEQFWHLNKVYEAAVVLGISSDSYDLLGLAQVSNSDLPKDETILAAVQGLVGKTNLAVPVYSSWRYQSKPLFQWAREHALVAAPVRRMAISEIQVQEITRHLLGDIATVAINRCALVRGDFRQSAISSRWREISELNKNKLVLVVRLVFHCDAGTYIRSLAHELGQRLKNSGLLWELRRTAVGPFKLEDPAIVRLVWPQ